MPVIRNPAGHIHVWTIMMNGVGAMSHMLLRNLDIIPHSYRRLLVLLLFAGGTVFTCAQTSSDASQSNGNLARLLQAMPGSCQQLQNLKPDDASPPPELLDRPSSAAFSALGASYLRGKK